MPRAIWDDTGTRTFEAGVDRGMLYVSPFAGVVWNGLISVSESPSGGDTRGYFFEGEKYLNQPKREEYTATITALSSPPEFVRCAGVLKLSPGLFTDGQPRRQFGFSYRSMIGDDVQLMNAGYKIHLVYNAMAKISSFTHVTDDEKSGVGPYSWDVVTIPELISSLSPSSHFIIDSRKVSSGALSSIEDALYGTSSTDPRLPSVAELLIMAGS